MVIVLAFGFAGAAAAADPSPAYSDPKEGDGCWVRFFAERDFREPLGRLAGPLYVTSTSGPGLVGQLDENEYFSRVHSVAVGPDAKLYGYAQPAFSEEILALEPGRKAADLGVDFARRVVSLKIVCMKP